MLIARTFMLLTLVVWIGGLIFFAFVLAPTVFTVLPTTVMAGNVVSRSLGILHWMGIFSAVIFLLCSLLYSRARFAQLKPLMLVNVFVLLMLALTLVSQFAISPRMHVLRADLGSSISPNEAARVEFDRLHVWSTRLESGVLLLGLGSVVLTARRFS
jgi:Domain of unknown function (DUF4149)